MTTLFRSQRRRADDIGPVEQPRATGADTRWDEAVARLPDGSVYQTSAWAQAKGPRFTSRLVTVRDGEAGPSGLGVTGGGTGSDGGIRAGARMLIRTVGPLARVAYVPYGPLLAEPDPNDADADADSDRRNIIELLEAEARAAGCGALLVQPSRRDHRTARVLEGQGYRPAPVDVATTAALEVALGRSDDELLAGMSKYRRRNVRRARRRGVIVAQGTRADLPVLEHLYRSSAARHGFLPMSLDYLERQWDALHPPGHLHLFLARLGGEVVAAGTLLAFGPWAEFKLTGWDGTAAARSAFANEAVNWAMMQWANQAGHQVFDLGGLPRDQARRALETGDEDELRHSGSQFKRGWGGTVAVYPATYQKVLTPIGHLTYSLPSRLLGDQGVGGRLVNLVRRS